MSSNVKHNLDRISAEINKYKDISRDDLFTQCLNERLKRTLEQYVSDIDLSSDFLISVASMRVLKAMTKLRRQADREVIKENMKGVDND